MPKKLSELTEAELKDQIRKYSIMTKEQPSDTNFRKVLGFLQSEQLKRASQETAVTTINPPTKVDHSFAMRRSQRLNRSSQRISPPQAPTLKTGEKKGSSRRLKSKPASGKSLAKRILIYVIVVLLIGGVGAFVYSKQLVASKAGAAMDQFLSDRKIPLRYESLVVHPIDDTVTLHNVALKPELLPVEFTGDQVQCKSVAIFLAQEALDSGIYKGGLNQAREFNVELNGLHLSKMLPDQVVEQQHLKNVMVRVMRGEDGKATFKILNKDTNTVIKNKLHWLELITWLSTQALPAKGI